MSNDSLLLVLAKLAADEPRSPTKKMAPPPPRIDALTDAVLFESQRACWPTRRRLAFDEAQEVGAILASFDSTTGWRKND